MIPVAVSLIGMKLRTESVLFLGWFGPRGLASVVLLLIAMEEMKEIEGIKTISLVSDHYRLYQYFCPWDHSRSGKRMVCKDS